MKLIGIALLLLPFSLAAQLTGRPVNSLTQTDDQREFLEAAFHLRQEVNRYEDSVMIYGGFRSADHQQAVDSLQMTDSLLIMHIADYLDHYGYPKQSTHGELANRTPLMIFAISQDSLIRKEHFGTFLNAYRDEYIPQRKFIEYLEGEYKLRFRQRFDSYSRDEQRVRELIKALHYNRRL